MASQNEPSSDQMLESVKAFLMAFQDKLCHALAAEEPRAEFFEEAWKRELGGGGRTRVIADGDVLEKGGVNFSHVHGGELPPSASAVRPELAGRSFTAMGVSWVIHPRNPYVPTSHGNVRFFIANKEGEPPVWWFGGGIDLTPYYPFHDDVIHWHETARNACDAFNEDFYPRFKSWCDDYFMIKHRNETRGVGGLFFDDLNEPDFDTCFAFMQSVANAYPEAFLPILQKRKDTPFGERERTFQAHRRGRYVEFNLVYDRGTLFGLQSGGRTESILMSMPPMAQWSYQYQVEEGSPEAELYEYLQPRDWLGSKEPANNG